MEGGAAVRKQIGYAYIYISPIPKMITNYKHTENPLTNIHENDPHPTI